MHTLSTVAEEPDEDEADDLDTYDSFHETIYYVEPLPELLPTRWLDETAAASVPERRGIVLLESNSKNNGTASELQRAFAIYW